ncbi:unnamed protein product [Prunus armeniaca]|uniref:Uncharacterized protein n=1 Tax=Prunus armeniaca TaxID=36596 RepID=A0A6J5WP78_PRUAR|nr:unnamed protein product [Prunus armeniaca]CAB4303359.1 unnamed protein product [Prunus armeniaca]
MTEEKTLPLIETAEFELIQGRTNSAGETELDESVFELLESSGSDSLIAIETLKENSFKIVCQLSAVSVKSRKRAKGGGEDGEHNSMMKTEENSEHTRAVWGKPNFFKC